MVSVETYLNGALMSVEMYGRSLVLTHSKDFGEFVGKELQVEDFDTLDVCPVKVSEGFWIDPDEDSFVWSLKAGDRIRILQTSYGNLKRVLGEVVTVVSEEDCILDLDYLGEEVVGQYDVRNIKFEWADLAEGE